MLLVETRVVLIVRLISLQVSFDVAAESYRSACAMQIAQGCYDLGWVYEYGLGVPQKDTHLAKRYYDSSLEVSCGLAGAALLILWVRAL